MKNRGVLKNDGQGAVCKWLQAVQVVAIGLVLLATLPLSAQDKKDLGATGPGKGNSVGFIASDEAGAEEVGLPLYPGARPHKENPDDSSAVQLGLWGGRSGFKLVVLKLESNDAPEKVAAFYHKALAKYGRVWNCADSTKAAGELQKNNSPNDLNCQEDQPESGETVLKAGTKAKQHIVGIKPEEGRSIIQLVYVEAPVSDGKK